MTRRSDPQISRPISHIDDDYAWAWRARHAAETLEWPAM
jgi:hypothetical protein